MKGSHSSGFVARQGGLDLGRTLYQEAECGVSWYEAGVSAGLTGSHIKVSVAAQRLAKAYARTYRQPWPLDDVDALEGKEALRLVTEGASWDEVATQLHYESAAEAQEHVKAVAHRAGVPVEVVSLGKRVYDLRAKDSNWDSVATAAGVPVKTARRAVIQYARAMNMPWPIRYKAPAWGQIGYERRVQTGEMWHAIADDLGLNWEYLAQEAKIHAQSRGLRWPLPPSPRPHRDTGEEAYELRAQERISWEAVGAALKVSKAWALLTAQHHAKDTGKRWPIREAVAESVEAEAYQMRTTGVGWADVGTAQGCPRKVAMERARRHAARTGLTWPIPVAPVRTTFSARAKAAYERGYVKKEQWQDIAADLGYTDEQSCRNSARSYAERFGRPLPIQRRHMTMRVPDRPRQVYEAKVSSPQSSWAEIGRAYQYRAWRSAYTAASQYAKKSNLPWPPGRMGSEGVPDGG